MITVNQPRENGRTTFCRQFTYNPKGEYNSRRDGAIVSGTPVAGQPVSALPVGSKIALTDPAKLSAGEVGYIIFDKPGTEVLLMPDFGKFEGEWSNVDQSPNQYIGTMSTKAQTIISTKYKSATYEQLLETSATAFAYIKNQSSNEARTRRKINTWYFINSTINGYRRYVDKFGSFGYSTSSSTVMAYRPVFSIPSTTLVLPEPNAAGAYELV